MLKRLITRRLSIQRTRSGRTLLLAVIACLLAGAPFLPRGSAAPAVAPDAAWEADLTLHPRRDAQQQLCAINDDGGSARSPSPFTRSATRWASTPMPD